MAQTLEALARRTTSMQGIRSIVHTMKTLAIINAAPYEHAAQAIDAYYETVLEALHAYLSQTEPLNLEIGDSAARIVVVFGSDHGLCGNYNEALAAHVKQHISSGIDDGVTILCVGAQMADALTDRGLNVQKAYFPPASIDGIGRLANLLTQKLADIRQISHRGEICVSLAYLARDKDGTQNPKIAALLPIDPELIRTLHAKPWSSRSLPQFTMRDEDLFLALLRGYIFASLYQASAEALVTENAARLALMQQAEQSVDARLDTLKSDTRALRQTEITTELLDVIIGFEALKKRKTQTRA